jgi:hypothetical protein
MAARKTTPKKATRKTTPKKTTAKKAAPVKGEEKAKNTATIRQLDQTAKRINAELDKAKIADKRGDDLRLAAALELDKAKQLCESAGIKFKAWSEKNVTQSWETVRKLAVIGGADNPAQAMLETRQKNAKANKKARANVNKKDVKPAPRIAAAKPEEVILDQIAKLDEPMVVNLLKSEASNYGLKVVGAEDVAADLESLKTAFKGLKASQRRSFVVWAVEQIGAKVTLPGQGIDKDFDTGEDGLDIPKAMRRTRKTAPKAA